ncbi:hypothetical protein NDU88_006887 [Pleurodeles waltl]|uniref:Uncharacterized protein n=1 Tax=Pleurodeles waltl TaxID=8319 RepID=A0AAV7TYW4_PLEWA|nr:hypothetical protein NDU88_006887 [Pleurodeles waltl]
MDIARGTSDDVIPDPDILQSETYQEQLLGDDRQRKSLCAVTTREESREELSGVSAEEKREDASGVQAEESREGLCGVLAEERREDVRGVQAEESREELGGILTEESGEEASSIQAEESVEDTGSAPARSGSTRITNGASRCSRGPEQNTQTPATLWGERGLSRYMGQALIAVVSWRG